MNECVVWESLHIMYKCKLSEICKLYGAVVKVFVYQSKGPGNQYTSYGYIVQI